MQATGTAWCDALLSSIPHQALRASFPQGKPKIALSVSQRAIQASLGEGGGPRKRRKESCTTQKLPQSPIGDSSLTEGAENYSGRCARACRGDCRIARTIPFYLRLPCAKGVCPGTQAFLMSFPCGKHHRRRRDCYNATEQPLRRSRASSPCTGEPKRRIASRTALPTGEA